MQGATEAEEALGRADAAMAELDVDRAIVHLSAAIRGFTAAGLPRPAAMACVRLGDTMANLLGNLTAARAWFGRATRLVADEPPCLEQGWVAVAAMGCDVDDPDDLLAKAELALDRAREFGDLNLETKALADGGLAHVQAGRISEGMAMLDEAMALVCGPTDDGETAAKSVCSFFTACYFAADFERAGSWADLLRQQGLIGTTPPGPAFLSSHCDSVQATLLMELGRWSEAEAVLLRAKADFEAAMGVPSWHPDIALADLRIRQGRTADAEALLLGKDQALQALLPFARLHQVRGDHELALATVARGLRVLRSDRLRAVELLTVKLDAQLATGDHEGGEATCDALAALTLGLEVVPLQARADAAVARLCAARGDVHAAIASLEAIVDRLDPHQHPWLCASLLVDLARLQDQAGVNEAARRTASVATAAFDQLDIVLRSDDAVLLDRLRSTDRVRRTVVAELHRDGSWWSASCEGTSVKLRDTKGLRYLAELVAVPGVERHALDLVDRVEGLGTDGQPDRRALGDAGAVIDSAARTAYRHRIESLRVDIEDALEEGRLEAAETLQEDLDQLVSQLAQAFGLGGRARVVGSAAERARLNVTRALRTALAKLTEALPGPGAALDRGVRTGLYCAYDPGDADVRWIVHT